MVTDKELLELAAKAAGIDAHCFGSWGYVKDDDGDYCKPWNPLTDDGDALRLAVKLRISPRYDGTIHGNEGWIVGYVSADYKSPRKRYSGVCSSVSVKYVPEEMFHSAEHNDARMANYYMESGKYVRDIEAATRRAIVRAAAEIGKEMK